MLYTAVSREWPWLFEVIGWFWIALVLDPPAGRATRLKTAVERRFSDLSRRNAAETTEHGEKQRETVGMGQGSDVVASPFGGPSSPRFSFQLSVFLGVHLWLHRDSDRIVPARASRRLR